jgi:hypothetical protein
MRKRKQREVLNIMGKKFQLSTEKLKQDYILAARLLRKFAHVRKMNNSLFKKLNLVRSNTGFRLFIEAEIRLSRKLAKRFADRARRMS